ncbi:MOSC domain-containing protein [Sulfitobacter sp. SK012]|uniref:MOSC domain-containing protein n=1 Tax=Sulfitobacter sp. SK012 TaxID=1389005 RepID=UPI0015765E78|nr:MOSC domain-containing protein [Sulfitobacter sp. SK012]
MGVSGLFRHPLKSHGREALDHVRLNQDQSMPFDRLWAVAHEAAKADGSEWAACQNFSRGSKAPKLMAINASLNEATQTLTLTHPERPDLTFRPDDDSAAFIDWVMPLVPSDRALPDRILRLDGRGFTDSDFASVSLCSVASHAEVEDIAQTPLSPLRWRGNIWFDGTAPWAEFDWVGRDIAIGGAVLQIQEPIVRCLATTANPETGLRDVDTLAALKTMDHQHFGIYARVIQTGDIAVGDKLELI